MFVQEGTICEAPMNLHRASVYIQGNHIICTGSAAVVNPASPPVLTFSDYLSSLKVLDWCLKSLVMVDEDKPLRDALMAGLSATITASVTGPLKTLLGPPRGLLGQKNKMTYSQVR